MIIIPRKKKYAISLGSGFRLSKRPAYDDLFIMRSVKNTGSWFGKIKLVPGKWNLAMWMLNDTHYVHYLNGIKTQTKAIGPAMNRPVDIQSNNEWRINENLDAGNFSVGPIEIWFGRKSPVLMWRFYQQGLLDYDEN